jgi:hypothetical protein
MEGVRPASQILIILHAAAEASRFPYARQAAKKTIRLVP